MKRQLTLTTELINEPALLKQRSLSSGMGAVLCFLGFVRETEGNDNIRALEYEVFQRMAEHQINLMLSHALEDFVFESADVVVPLGLPHKPHEAKHCAHTTGKRPLLEQGGLINQLGRECQLPFHSVRELSTLHWWEQGDFVALFQHAGRLLVIDPYCHQRGVSHPGQFGESERQFVQQGVEGAAVGQRLRGLGAPGKALEIGIEADRHAHTERTSEAGALCQSLCSPRAFLDRAGLTCWDACL